MSKFERISDLEPNPSRQGHGGLRAQGIIKSSSDEHPLVTVITVVFNGEAYLEKTILSIVGQSYPNLEFIIIDGGSKDSSLEIIRKYEKQIDFWVSEKDAGISDAFNKGVLLSSGDYINFQGDGDGFVNQNSISDLMKRVNPKEDMLISAQVKRIGLNGELLYISKARRFQKCSLLFRMSLPHQGLFTHRKMFEQYGLFDVQNKFCMDYDFLLRAYQTFPKVRVSPRAVANWRADGLGTGKTLQVLKEYDVIKRKNKVAPEWILNFLNFWIVFKFKVKQGIGKA